MFSSVIFKRVYHRFVESDVHKELMGHSDIKTTEIYARLNVDDLCKAVEKIRIVRDK